jgi:hypothetical protein
MPLRIRRAAEWALWLLHTPLAVFWLITAILTGATVVELIRAPRHGLELLSLVGVMIGLVNVLARLKGLAAWPTRAAHDALSVDADADEREP